MVTACPTCTKAGEARATAAADARGTATATLVRSRVDARVIATVLANAMINRGGPALVSELTAATSASAGEVALAYAAVRDAYGLTELNAAIDGLDGHVPGAVQLALYAQVEALLRQEALWFLRNGSVTEGLADLVARHRSGVEQLREAEGLLPDAQRQDLDGRIGGLVAHGVPQPLAQRIGELPFLSHASDIVLVAERSGVDVLTAARAYFGVAGLFDLFAIIENGRSIVLGDRFDRMALDRALANLMRALRDLTADVLAAGNVESFVSRRSVAVARTVKAVKDMTEGGVTVSRLSVAAGLLADLAKEG